MMQKLESYGSLVLRIGLAVVFVWFGFKQITNTQMWTGIVPAWAVSMSGLAAAKIVVMNGWFEIVAAILLALGIFTRWVALVLGVHLLVIASGFGINNPTGIRDFGLAIANFSLFFSPGKYNLKQ